MAEAPDFKAIIKDEARGDIKDFITKYWAIVGGENKELDKSKLDGYADQLMKNGAIEDDGVSFKLSEFQQKAATLGITEIDGIGDIADLTKKVPKESEIDDLANAANAGYKKSTENWFSLEGLGTLISAVMSFVGDFFSWMTGQGEFPGSFDKYMTAAAAPGVANNIANEISELREIDPSIRQKVIDGVNETTNYMAANGGEMPDKKERPEVTPLTKEDLKSQFVDDLVAQKVDAAIDTKDANGKTQRDNLKGKYFDEKEITDIIDKTKEVLSSAAADKNLPSDPTKAKAYIEEKLNVGFDELAKKHHWSDSKIKNWTLESLGFIEKGKDVAQVLSEDIAKSLGDENIGMLITSSEMLNGKTNAKANPLAALDKDGKGTLTIDELGKDLNGDGKLQKDEFSDLIKNMSDEQKTAFNTLLAKAENAPAVKKNGQEVTEIDFNALPATPGKPQGLQIG